jgi:hypothetical protein
MFAFCESLSNLASNEISFKRESDTRFLTSGYFHESMSLGPQSILLGPFQFFFLNLEMFIGVNNTSDILLLVSLLPVIIYCLWY